MLVVLHLQYTQNLCSVILVHMTAFHRLLQRLGLVRSRVPHRYALDGELYQVLDSLAEQQKRSPDEMVSDLLSEAISQRQVDKELQAMWQSLSPREQQVAALGCLDFTNPQIAARLGYHDARAVSRTNGQIYTAWGLNDSTTDEKVARTRAALAVAGTAIAIASLCATVVFALEQAHEAALQRDHARQRARRCARHVG